MVRENSQQIPEGVSPQVVMLPASRADTYLFFSLFFISHSWLGPSSSCRQQGLGSVVLIGLSFLEGPKLPLAHCPLPVTTGSCLGYSLGRGGAGRSYGWLRMWCAADP